MDPIKSLFTTALEVRRMAGGTWLLLRDLVYQSASRRARFIVPAGFVTDFASVPRVPIVYLLTGNTAHAAAVLHDYLYQTHAFDLTRAEVDALFREAMESTWESWWRRWTMWMGVRVGGRRAWRTGPERFTLLNPGRPNGS